MGVATVALRGGGEAWRVDVWVLQQCRTVGRGGCMGVEGPNDGGSQVVQSRKGGVVDQVWTG